MVFCDFCDFFWSGAPLSGNPAVECQKLGVFCDFFLVGCTSLKENEGRVSKTGGFLRFWGSRNCPENCAHDSFCLIRPFFRERKNERKSPKNVKNWGFLAIFSCSKQPSAGIRLSSVKNWVFFAIFFWSGAPLSGKTRVECQKLGVFGVFGGPETVLKTVLTIRFASYGRFFERGKMSENRQKTSKTGGFWRFFRVRSNPLPESGCRVSKTGGFLRFWCARICAHDSFCFIRPCPDPVPR